MDVRPFSRAMGAIAATAGQDLPAVLEAVAHQAEVLLGCRDVEIDLSEGFSDELVFRPTRVPEDVAALGGPASWRADSRQRRQLEVGDPLWEVGDGAPRDPAEPCERAWRSGIGARLTAPMLTGGDLVGVLTASWPESDAALAGRLEVAAALAQIAAVAVRTARLLRSQRALVEAARVATSSASRDLDATLDALVEQATGLLSTDDVLLHLVDPLSRQFVRRSGDAGVAPSARFAPSPLVEEAVALGRPIFTADFQGDRRVSPREKAELPSVRAGLVMPLLVDGELVGGLFAHWTRRHRLSPSELEIADAFARQAALAIRGARLLEERGRARRELEAVLDAATDAVVVFRADGRLLHGNRVALGLFGEHLGEIPGTLDELVARARPTSRDGEPLASTPMHRAVDGEVAEDVMDVRGAGGGRRRFHVRAAPVTDSAGQVLAAVAVARDITVLEDAISARARLDGAVLTSRLVAHELNTKLAIVIGNAELLRAELTGSQAELADDVLDGAEDAARIVARLQRLIRVEETELAGVAMLDLDAATSPS